MTPITDLRVVQEALGRQDGVEPSAMPGRYRPDAKMDPALENHILDYLRGVNARIKVQIAAPELLAALAEMLAVFGDHEQYDSDSAEVVAAARAAIAKAQGRLTPAVSPER